MEIRLSPLLTEDGPVLISTLRDLSEQRAEMATYAVEQASLRERIRQLTLRDTELGSEMAQAATILEAHLPPKNLSMPGVEMSWKFSPCHTLGGDMVKLFPVSEEFLGFCILDVSGHGVPAALLAISLARSFSTARPQGGILLGRGGELRRPQEILSKLNAQYQVLHEGELFVTLLYGILDVSKRIVRYVSAGHPHPWLISKERVFVMDGPINPPVGVLQEIAFEETVSELAPGDRLLFFTDGVTEMRSPDGAMYGEERLLDFLSRNRGLELADLHNNLYQELSRFRAEGLQTDDVTSLLIELSNESVT